jgi:hypothetical protein
MITVSGLDSSAVILSPKPPSAFGNPDLTAYVSAANTVVLHCFDPSSLSVTPPSGAYTVVQVNS